MADDDQQAPTDPTALARSSGHASPALQHAEARLESLRRQRDIILAGRRRHPLARYFADLEAVLVKEVERMRDL